MKEREMNGWNFLKLIYALRAVGIPICIQEIQEAMKVLVRFSDLAPQIVFRTIFIHRKEDIDLFELVWQVLFQNLKNDSMDSESLDPPNCRGQEGQGDQNRNQQQGLGTGNCGITLYPGQETSMKSSILEFKMPDVKEFMKLKGFPSKIDEVEDLEDLDFEEQIKFILGQSGFLTWANSLELANSRGEILEADWIKIEELRNLWDQQIRKALLIYRMESGNRWDPLRKVNWRYKPLNRFTLQEENVVHHALRQMGKNLAARPGWRKKRANCGVIRLSSALREMVRGNGLIYRLEFEQYALQRPELVVLCDVSNSIARFSQFLLFLIKRIKSRFRRVRIYLFIDVIWDISYDNWVEAEDSLEQIHAWSRKNSSGFTDYGRVFNEFSKDWLSEISTRATLLILGDGRNNFRPSQAEYLKEIQEKVRCVYWLNPLEEREWGDRDNLMREYKPFCTRVFRCRTIEDVWRIAREVF